MNAPAQEGGAIRGWILEAGEIPSPDPGDAGKRLPRCMLIQFDTVEDCRRVGNHEPATIVLDWIWNKPKGPQEEDGR